VSGLQTGFGLSPEGMIPMAFGVPNLTRIDYNCAN
jgi:hypothetical protein